MGLLTAHRRALSRCHLALRHGCLGLLQHRGVALLQAGGVAPEPGGLGRPGLHRRLRAALPPRRRRPRVRRRPHRPAPASEHSTRVGACLAAGPGGPQRTQGARRGSRHIPQLGPRVCQGDLRPAQVLPPERAAAGPIPPRRPAPAPVLQGRPCMRVRAPGVAPPVRPGRERHQAQRGCAQHVQARGLKHSARLQYPCSARLGPCAGAPRRGATLLRSRHPVTAGASCASIPRAGVSQRRAQRPPEGFEGFRVSGLGFVNLQP